MPDYFWDWYKSKGYEKILTKEVCFENKAFLIGCCIEYLNEKGQKINNLHEQDNLDDILKYLTLGVAWIR
ncbi:MAG: hypothetical protein N4A54_03865 [Peptostreptococcaceae bacterium]|jgi:hypothetical protein|nr:hypothetical protein [Peptostreptococcaceae bacterium]